MPIWPGAVPAGQTLKKLTINKNMQHVLFLVKTNLCRNEGAENFKYMPVKHLKQHHIHALCRK